MAFISDRVTRLFRECLDFTDSDEVFAGLEEAGIRGEYVGWEDFDLSGEEAGARLQPGRPYDLGALLSAVLEIAEEARGDGLVPVVLPDDGVGCHVILAPSEDALFEQLLRVRSDLSAVARG